MPLQEIHFLRTQIDSTDFKKENLTTKISRNKDPEKTDETDQTIRLLDEIATFVPGKKAQLAAKKVSEKIQKTKMTEE